MDIVLGQGNFTSRTNAGADRDGSTGATPSAPDYSSVTDPTQTGSEVEGMDVENGRALVLAS